MLRDALLQVGAWHREQFVRQLHELCVFLRRASHMTSNVRPTIFLSVPFVTIEVALALAIGFAVGVSASQPPTPSRGNETRQAPTNGSQQNKQDSPIEPLGAHANPLIVRTNPSTSEARENQTDRLDQKYNRWANIGVGICTLAVLVIQGILFKRQNDIMQAQNTTMDGQLKATTTAAKAAEDSANGLKTINRQWVAIKKWECVVEPSVIVGKPQITLRLHIKNATALPLTLSTIRAQFDTHRGAYQSENELILPGEETTGQTWLFMSDEQVRQYGSGQLRVAVSGWIHFRDTFDVLQSQPFGRMYLIGRQGGDWVRLAGLHKRLRQLAVEWPLDLDIEQGAYKPEEWEKKKDQPKRD
jgi:hypothetical protein